MQTKEEEKNKAFNLIQAQSLIQEANFKNWSTPFLSQENKVFLKTIAEIIENTYLEAKNILNIEDLNGIDHYQGALEKVDSAYITARELLIEKIENLIIILSEEYKHNHNKDSKEYKTLLKSVLECCQGTIEGANHDSQYQLIQDPDGIYQFSNIYNIAFFPVNQSLDPLKGSTFSNKIFEPHFSKDPGRCLGLVTNWALQKVLSSTETSQFMTLNPITRYKQDFQEELISLLENEKSIFPAIDEILQKIEVNSVYEITLRGKNSAHGIGIRRSENQTIELFDPNFGLFLIPDDQTFKKFFGRLCLRYPNIIDQILLSPILHNIATHSFQNVFTPPSNISDKERLVNIISDIRLLSFFNSKKKSPLTTEFMLEHWNGIIQDITDVKILNEVELFLKGKDPAVLSLKSFMDMVCFWMPNIVDQFITSIDRQRENLLTMDNTI